MFYAESSFIPANTLLHHVPIHYTMQISSLYRSDGAISLPYSINTSNSFFVLEPRGANSCGVFLLLLFPFSLLQCTCYSQDFLVTSIAYGTRDWEERTGVLQLRDGELPQSLMGLYFFAKFSLFYCCAVLCVSAICGIIVLYFIRRCCV